MIEEFYYSNNYWPTDIEHAGCVKFNKLLNDKQLKEAYMRYIREDVKAMVNANTDYIYYAEMYKRGIKKVIFNPPATIVFWNDGSKTVVKAKNEPYDWEKGLAMAIAKKCYGNLGNYYNVFKKYEDEGEAKTKEANDGVSV